MRVGLRALGPVVITERDHVPVLSFGRAHSAPAAKNVVVEQPFVETGAVEGHVTSTRAHGCLSSFTPSTHAPSLLQNNRLCSTVANPLSRSRNSRADGDGCVGLHAMPGIAWRMVRDASVCT